MKHWTLLLLCAALCACASGPPMPVQSALFHDSLFTARAPEPDGANLFQLSPAMRAYLDGEIATQARSKGPRRALYDALYSKGQLKLDYDASITRNAAGTFAARSGNCLSLVIMTAALAREMGLAVEYQSVLTDESWSRSGDLYFVSGHVNLVLGRRLSDNPASYDVGARMTIDFLPSGDANKYHTVPLDEKTIVAMYMNNRAAETMAQGQLDAAYWWARAALEHDPAYMSAYNTLGVIYRRRGQLEAAERAFDFASHLAPDNVLVMQNLAQAWAGLGRIAESKALLRKVERLQPEPPFHFFNQGLAAMRRNDYREAARLFAREIERDPYYHEFHFWLAQAYAALGDRSGADRQLALAMNTSTSRPERELYGAKLDRLRALR